MCDYSLHLVASRPARVGDKLVSTRFSNSLTRGFAATGEPEVAVCLLPGTDPYLSEYLLGRWLDLGRLMTDAKTVRSIIRLMALRLAHAYDR